MAVPDIVLLPHADLHMALHGAGPLNLRVMLREHHAPPDLSFSLSDVTSTCNFDFFAPYQDTGKRLDNLPSVNPATGLVTAATPGIYLLQVRLNNRYIVARLQVHDTLLGWWFGNASLTVPVDTAFAHAQPSIYASFNAHPSGTDPVGDITGHGYVTLTAPAGTSVVVADFDRLRGTAEGNALISGSLGGTIHGLPVTMVDYARTRDELDIVRVRNLAAPAEAHNMVFIGEGFRDTPTDRTLFDRIVTKAVDDLFSKPRHQPYGLLEKSFNVWKAYQPSKEHGLTCAFRVNEAVVAPGPPRGSPIPYEFRVTDTDTYTVQALVKRVGLPRSNETDAVGVLLPKWNGQSLHDFDGAKVDAALVEAWKTQKPTGILEASDTFFGFRLGARPADRLSGVSVPIVLPPAADAPADVQLQPFIKRVYEFFEVDAARSVMLDPRRNALEVLANPAFDSNPGAPVMRYLSHLRWRKAPHPAVGQEWLPDPANATFKRSVGLVGILVNEGLTGGTNVCAGSMTLTAFGTVATVSFPSPGTAAERPMRRALPADFKATIDEIIDTVAHEFGHSFNLADEYEEFEGPDANARLQVDYSTDNVSHLGAVYHHGAINPDGTVTLVDEQIDPARVKWFELLRMKVSSVLTIPAVVGGGGMVLTIAPAQTAAWVAIKKKNPVAMLRARNFPASGQQLPLSVAATDIQVGLTLGAIDEAKGTIVVTGTGLPPAGSPVFSAGALLFSPVLAPDFAPARVVERKVLGKMAATHVALNVDANNTKKNDKEDIPVDIDGYKPPCKAYKVIGLYEGAAHVTGRAYRPAGLCKMRTKAEDDAGFSAFCHVCKWLIVNRVDASLHAILDDTFYPKARKGGDG
jgi:hypothetical protein